MDVTGVTVAHQGAGEFREYPTGVDVVTSAPADVHQRQILGAGHVHIRQRPGGPPGGLIGV
jgi:L-aminopeptidase/D-esterase-like protein